MIRLDKKIKVLQESIKISSVSCTILPLEGLLLVKKGEDWLLCDSIGYNGHGLTLYPPEIRNLALEDLQLPQQMLKPDKSVFKKIQNKFSNIFWGLLGFITLMCCILVGMFY